MINFIPYIKLTKIFLFALLFQQYLIYEKLGKGVIIKAVDIVCSDSSKAFDTISRSISGWLGPERGGE